MSESRPIRYAAFLRAINVGGHTVKMAALRRIFSELGFTRIETFMASGNVIFETPSGDETELARQIERRLEKELGFAVVTFLRTAGDLARIAAYEAFGATEIETARALNIAFVGEQLDESATLKVLALETSNDRLQVHDREIYWLCQTRQSEAAFSNAMLEKTLGRPSTLRGAATVAKIVARYGESGVA